MGEKAKRLNRAIVRIALFVIVGATAFEAATGGGFSLRRAALMSVIGVSGVVVGGLLGRFIFLRQER